MDQWKLKANREVVLRINHMLLQVAEIQSPIEIKKREVFTKLIRRRRGNSLTPVELESKLENDYHEHTDDDEEPRMTPGIEDSIDSTGKVITQQPFYDRLINSEVELQLGDIMKSGKEI